MVIDENVEFEVATYSPTLKGRFVPSLVSTDKWSATYKTQRLLLFATHQIFEVDMRRIALHPRRRRRALHASRAVCETYEFASSDRSFVFGRPGLPRDGSKLEMG
jgi:hypothetical protein